jgi:gluconolactonase
VSNLKPVIALVFLALMSAPAAGETKRIEASYPEGPLWSGAALFVAEMGADQVSLIQNGRKRAFFKEKGCGPTAIAKYRDGFAINCHLGAAIIVTDGRGRVIERMTKAQDGRALNNPNDITGDGAGGVYFSDPGPFSRDVAARGYIMHLSRSGVLRRVAGPLWYPNGVFFDAEDNRLFVSEHLARRVLSFAVQSDLSLGEKRQFVDIDAVTQQVGTYREAGPDGLERGPDGALYVCLYGEGRILKLSRAGALVASIPVGIPFLTNIAFKADGAAAIVGSFVNDRPPFLGEVRIGPLPQVR